MQELNQYKDLPNTTEEDEAFKQMENIGLKELFAGMGSDLTGGKSNTFDAPNPQPTLCESTQTPTLTDIINNICTQLQLLTTVIGEQARNTTPPEGIQSLQETVSLTLQQADWFKDLIRHELVALDIEEIAKDAVESIVENEVESYFEHSFDPSNHFDFDDAVHDAVGDRIDEAVADAVDDKIDQAVENYMDNATLTITRG